MRGEGRAGRGGDAGGSDVESRQVHEAVDLTLAGWLT